QHATRTHPRRMEQPPRRNYITDIGKTAIEAATKEIRNEYIRRLLCLQSVVREPCSWAGPGSDGSAMAPAHDLFVRSISAGAALHARPRSKMASEACARLRVRKLGAAPIIGGSIAERIERGHAYDLHPIRCQHGTHLHGRRACNGVGELRSADHHTR